MWDVIDIQTDTLVIFAFHVHSTTDVGAVMARKEVDEEENTIWLLIIIQINVLQTELILLIKL